MSTKLPAFEELRTDRLKLRCLTVEDVGPEYLAWFSTPGAAFISGGQPQSLESLRAFVMEKTSQPDTLLIGIFEKATDRHIGNIKYEPIDVKTGEAVLGIFVGEPSYQGIGIAGEVIVETAKWLKTHAGVRQIALGVSVGNIRARQSYEKLGFVVGETTRIPVGDTILPMIWEIS